MKKWVKTGNILITIIVIFLVCLTVLDVSEREYPTDYNKDNIVAHVENLAQEPHAATQKDSHEKAKQYIVSQLAAMGIENADTLSSPAYVIHHAIIRNESESNESMNITESYNLDNIVVSIPANSPHRTNQAILIMAHYDSVPMGPGASDDAVAAGVMLEAIRYQLQAQREGMVTKNDLIFLFTDGEEMGLLGAAAFMKEFSGFDHLQDRIRFAANLESRGTSGTLIMFETSAGNYQSMRLFAQVNRNVFTSSIANLVYQMMPNGTDFSEVKGFYQGFNLANIGGGENYHTQNDSLENVKMSYLSQQAVFVHDLIMKTSDLDLDKLNDNADAVFFSYLNITTVVYSYSLAYILAIITLGLMVSVIALRIVRRQRTLRFTARGFAVISVSLVASALAVYTGYYVFSLMAAFVETIDIHEVGKITYSSLPLVICIMVLVMAVTAFIAYRLGKLLKITMADMTRALAYLMSFLGVVLSFALPVTSYLFIISGMFLMFSELLNLTVKNPELKNLRLPLLIFGLTMPIFFPMVVLASDALGMGLCFLFAALFSLYILQAGSSVTDFFRYVSFERAVRYIKKDHRIPERPICGIRSILGLIILVLAFLTTGTADLSANRIGKQSMNRLGYDDALVYVITPDETYYRISDTNSAPTLLGNLTGYTYNNQIESYVKKDENPTFSLVGLSSVSLNDNTMTVDRKSDDGYIDIIIEAGHNISMIEAHYESETVTYEITDPKLIFIRIRNDAVLILTTKADALIDAKITTSELLINYEGLKDYHDFQKIAAISQAKYNLIYQRDLK